MNAPAYDTVVIGSGLVGAWAAKELAAGGLKVLILEAGPWLSESQIMSVPGESDERLRALGRQPIQSRHPAYWRHSPQLFIDDLENPYIVPAHSPFSWIRCRQVGGRSTVWGGVTLRFSDQEFSDPDRDGVGPRWPIRYSDLASEYTMVERFLGVRGSLGNLPQLPDGQFRSAAQFTPAELEFKRSVEARWHDRRVLMTRGVETLNSACDHTTVQAIRGSSLELLLPAALSTGRVTLQPDAIVSHLIVDPDTADVVGVVYVNRLTHAWREVYSRVVILAASTIESIRIMLNSRTRQHPRGVGHSSGGLGVGLVEHQVIRVAGTGLETLRAARPYPFGGPYSICIPRFTNISARHQQFCRGYGVWGGIHRKVSRVDSNDGVSWQLAAISEVLYDPNNRVDLEDHVDAWGIKVVRIAMRYGPNERALMIDAVRTLEEMAVSARLNIDHRSLVAPGQYVHELGGARMGTTPKDSVLNAFNQCWDARHLFVVDGSAFVTSGWQNPTLTMMALAGRASRYILTEIKTGSL